MEVDDVMANVRDEITLSVLSRYTSKTDQDVASFKGSYNMSGASDGGVHTL